MQSGRAKPWDRRLFSENSSIGSTAGAIAIMTRRLGRWKLRADATALTAYMSVTVSAAVLWNMSFIILRPRNGIRQLFIVTCAPIPQVPGRVTKPVRTTLAIILALIGLWLRIMVVRREP